MMQKLPLQCEASGWALSNIKKLRVGLVDDVVVSDQLLTALILRYRVIPSSESIAEECEADANESILDEVQL